MSENSENNETNTADNSHPIWKYFNKVPSSIDLKNEKHQCKNCSAAPSMTINGGYSNLIKHLNSKHTTTNNLKDMYFQDFENYKLENSVNKSKQCTPIRAKRTRDTTAISSKPESSPLLRLGVTQTVVSKFSRNHASQKLYYDATVKMLIKTMYPVSFVEHPDVLEWLNIICPPFNVPCRNTIKNSALPKLREHVKKATIEQFKT